MEISEKKQTMRKSINVDWLQLTCDLPCMKNYHNYYNLKNKWRKPPYIVELDQAQTRHFAAIYNVLDGRTKEQVAVIATEPRSKLCLKDNTAIVKIINKYLYQKNLSHFVTGLLKELEITFRNITRLDLAVDFLTFNKRLTPQSFIHKLVSGTIMKVGQAKYKAAGDTPAVRRGALVGGFSSVKFGTETSDVSYYLYNKSLELKQVKNKPWILDNWISNGWDEVTDVWRLEYSIKRQRNPVGIIDDKTGNVIKECSFKDLSILDDIDLIFKHFYNTTWQFHNKEYTKKKRLKKPSRCKQVSCFDKKEFDLITCTIPLSHKRDSGRATKIFAKSLMNLNQELRGQDFDLGIVSNDMLTWIIKTRNLEPWAKKKLPEITYSDRVMDIISKGKASEMQMMQQLYKALPSDNRVKLNANQQIAIIEATENYLQREKLGQTTISFSGSPLTPDDPGWDFRAFD